VEFRGREMAHQELGHKIIQRLEEDLKDLGIIEQKAKMEGRNLSLTFMPKG
jgi:translation initiation factor IF-3